MPKCNHCETVLVTSAMRRSPKGGFICRDKAGCRHDKKRKDERAPLETPARAIRITN